MRVLNNELRGDGWSEGETVGIGRGVSTFTVKCPKCWTRDNVYGPRSRHGYSYLGYVRGLLDLNHGRRRFSCTSGHIECGDFREADLSNAFIEDAYLATTNLKGATLDDLRGTPKFGDLGSGPCALTTN
jgi:hypothetical protein